jgi:hypothetical protein
MTQRSIVGKTKMNTVRIALGLSIILCGLGCGPAPTVMPTGGFTEEQKAAAAAEYQKVEDEESMGNNKKFRKKTGR